jgi:hypothetical protein
MIVVKYFHEEPAGLELLADDTTDSGRAAGEAISLEAFLGRPSYYRGYLAGTDLATMATGATAPGVPGAWVDPVVRALSGTGWWAADPGGSWPAVDPGEILSAGLPGMLLVTAGRMPARPAPRLATDGVRRSLAPLRALLDEGATVFLAEPAPDGVDWAAFAREPVAARVREAFVASPVPDARRFVIPLREASGEHGFYFERYDLGLYARHEVR